MKKKLFSLAIIFIISSVSFTTYGQSAPGDSGDGSGSGDPSLVLPSSFKRNNGNGTCGGEAEIRVCFSVLPVHLPVITEIKYEGGSIKGLVFSEVDASKFARKGYVSYCIQSANIPPAHTLSIRFHYENSNQDFWIVQKN